MKHTTEIEIKKWQSRLASAIEDKETAERKLRELGVGIYLEKIQEKADAIINDPNFVSDFEEFIKSKPAPAAQEPKKVVYCGSIRVALEAFKKAEYDSLMRGEIALLPCCMFVDIQREYGAGSDYKKKADEQHKKKIDIADEVFVLNVGGYIGESTRSEIDYAISIGKPVKYLEPIDLAPAAPEPEVVPPDNAMDVAVILSDGREFYGWYWRARKHWHIYYNTMRNVSHPIRPGDTVVSWKEIE